MKQKIRLIFVVATLGLMNTAQANFVFYLDDPLACSSISGHWIGKGKASSWLGTCSYQGSGEVTSVDSEGNFIVDVISNKKSGMYLCPDQVARQLKGTCVNGVAKITTEYGSLHGTFSHDSGVAKGKLTVAPGSVVEVTIKFQRAG